MGAAHLFEDVVEHGAKRQKDLESAGFSVIRLSDDEVLNDINNVIFRIEDEIEELGNAVWPLIIFSSKD